MSIAATQAAIQLEQQSEFISPYRVISLLLEGALERIDQAVISFSDGDVEEGNLLVRKTIGIVNGLRASLDMEKGGEVALNLEALYEYIIGLLESGELVARLSVLSEASELLSEVKSGWDGIADSEPVAAFG